MELQAGQVVTLLFLMYLFGKDILCCGPMAIIVALLLLGQGRAGSDVVVAGRGLCCNPALARVLFSPQDDYLQAFFTQCQGVFRARFHVLPICGNFRMTESQNCYGWKGPLKILLPNPSAKAGYGQCLQRRRLHDLPG